MSTLGAEFDPRRETKQEHQDKLQRIVQELEGAGRPISEQDLLPLVKKAACSEEVYQLEAGAQKVCYKTMKFS